MGKWVAFLAILTASLVVVLQAQVHAAPQGAKAGDDCAVTVDGDGNVSSTSTRTGMAAWRAGRALGR